MINPDINENLANENKLLSQESKYEKKVNTENYLTIEDNDTELKKNSQVVKLDNNLPNNISQNLSNEKKQSKVKKIKESDLSVKKDEENCKNNFISDQLYNFSKLINFINTEVSTSNQLKNVNSIINELHKAKK
jgi:uncharacterized protein YeeX (DUF496 family)